MLETTGQLCRNLIASSKYCDCSSMHASLINTAIFMTSDIIR